MEDLSMSLARIRGTLTEFFLIILRSVEEKRVQDKKRNRYLRSGVSNGNRFD